MLRLLATANMEFVNMVLHLVTNCDPCDDCQIHTYRTIACINDVLAKRELTFYCMDMSITQFKGEDYKNTNEFCLKLFGKLHILTQTAWKSDSYF